MKNLITKLKWLINNCKFSFPYILGLVVIGSLLSSLTVKDL